MNVTPGQPPERIVLFQAEKKKKEKETEKETLYPAKKNEASTSFTVPTCFNWFPMFSYFPSGGFTELYLF